MEDHKIEGVQSYPIYKFTASWHEDGDAPYPNWKIGLPDGKIWNGTGWSKMYKTVPHQKEPELHILNWWEKYKNEKLVNKNPSTPLLHVELYEYETWCLDWFQHHTFDTGQTDEEALASFERFVQRKERIIREKGETAYCLMGAEDRYRWTGSGDDGKLDTNTKPPCRCKYCKEQGMIRIRH